MSGNVIYRASRNLAVLCTLNILMLVIGYSLCLWSDLYGWVLFVLPNVKYPKSIVVPSRCDPDGCPEQSLRHAPPASYKQGLTSPGSRRYNTNSLLTKSIQVRCTPHHTLSCSEVQLGLPAYTQYRVMISGIVTSTDDSVGIHFHCGILMEL